jgi:hypothetical protein
MSPRGTYPEWDKFLETYQPKSGWKDRGPAPVIETILVTGISEDRRVLMTVERSPFMKALRVKQCVG